MLLWFLFVSVEEPVSELVGPFDVDTAANPSFSHQLTDVINTHYEADPAASF